MAETDGSPTKGNGGNLIAALALIVSITAVAVAVLSDRAQRKHMRLSVKPIPTILYVQTEEELAVVLRNSGTGPMIVTSIRYARGDGTAGTTIVAEDEFKPSQAGDILLFELEGPSTLAAGDERRLVFFDASTGNDGASIRNQALRTKLNKTSIIVSFTDVYDGSFKDFSHQLMSRNIY